MKNISTS